MTAPPNGNEHAALRSKEAHPAKALEERPNPPLWQDNEEFRWAVRHWAGRMGVKVKQIHIRPMRMKWASISTRGRLTIDSGLLGLDKELGEFVIVHELVHLLVPNHGRVFKSFMYAYMPDWEQREGRLRNLEKEGVARKGKRRR